MDKSGLVGHASTAAEGEAMEENQAEKMTPMELDFARWIKKRRGVFRLRDIQRTPFWCEYRKLTRFLRLKGFIFHLTENRKRPGQNLYRVTPPGGVWMISDRDTRGPGRPTNEEVLARTAPLLPLEFPDGT